MSRELVLCFAAVVFVIQLFLCFTANKEWKRLLPLSLALSFEILCWVLFFVGKLIQMEASISFPAFILGYVGLYWVFAPIAAWMVYTVVNVVQKRIK